MKSLTVACLLFIVLIVTLLLFPGKGHTQTTFGNPNLVVNIGGQYTTADATIAASGTSSAAVDLHGYVLTGIYFPATFTGTAVTFTTSNAIAGTYQPVYNSSGVVSYTIAQARYYAIDPKDFKGVRYLKVVSGSTEGSTRTLTLSLKKD